MTRSQYIRILALIILPSVLAAATAITGMLLIPDLPAILAVHWGLDGSVDRTDGIGSYVTLVAVLVGLFTAGIAAFSIVSLRHATSNVFVRSMVGLSTWFGVFISLSMYLGVLAQRGVTDATTVPADSVLVPLIVGFAVAAIVAALAVVLTPRVPSSHELSAEPLSVHLGDGELAYWARTSRTPRRVIAIPIGAFVLITVLFIIVGIPPWAIILVGVLLGSLFTMLTWRVVVDRHGLTVTGLFGFPRIHVSLDQIVAATVTTVVPFGEFGGWGVRVGRSGRWGVIVRRGEAIEVQKHSGANFVVTVDDADTAARLLTALASRSREG